MSAEKEVEAVANTLDLPPINELNWDTISNYDYSGVTETITTHGLSMLLAIVIFFVGKWIAARIVNVMKKSFAKAKIEKTLADFIGNIAYGGMLAMVIIAAMAQMGIETTSFAAVLAAAGLAVGLALQGSLSNFAAGVLIILFRPFKSGDYIEAAGVGGTVQDISIFTTQLLTPDNRMVVVPNNNITTGVIVNYSAMPTRRLDLVIGVAYDADLPKTQALLKKIIEENQYVLKKPEYVVEVLELGASSVDFAVRPWVKTANYWNAKFELQQQIKIALDKAGIGIPFPQRDVHLFIEEGTKLPVATKASSKRTTKKAA